MRGAPSDSVFDARRSGVVIEEDEDEKEEDEDEEDEDEAMIPVGCDN